MPESRALVPAAWDVPTRTWDQAGATWDGQVLTMDAAWLRTQTEHPHVIRATEAAVFRTTSRPRLDRTVELTGA